MRDVQTPTSYPYDSVNCSYVEDYVTAWQIQVVLGFCSGDLSVLGKGATYVLSEQPDRIFDCYVHSDEAGKFFNAFLEALPNNVRWVVALGFQFSGTPIAKEDVATVVAHYLLGDPTDSALVQIARDAICRNMMSFLTASSCAHAASAFGDGVTARAIQSFIRTP